jgi:hypothetical protein
MGLNESEAEQALDGAELVPCGQAGVAEAKEIQSACLAADIPMLLGRDNHCVKGCAPKLYLLVREDDVPRVAGVMKQRGAEVMMKSGIDPASIRLGVEAGEDEEPPCPACGSKGALVEGACPECGLQLG